jgi:hypothetical protein
MLKASEFTRFQALSNLATGREQSAAAIARHEHSSPANRQSSPTTAHTEITSERECVREVVCIGLSSEEDI